MSVAINDAGKGADGRGGGLGGGALGSVSPIKTGMSSKKLNSFNGAEAAATFGNVSPGTGGGAIAAVDHAGLTSEGGSESGDCGTRFAWPHFGQATVVPLLRRATLSVRRQLEQVNWTGIDV